MKIRVKPCRRFIYEELCNNNYVEKHSKELFRHIADNQIIEIKQYGETTYLHINGVLTLKDNFYIVEEPNESKD